jgi:hypothetical protein
VVVVVIVVVECAGVSSMERRSEACWRAERVMAHPTTARFMHSGSRRGGSEGFDGDDEKKEREESSPRG